MQTLYIHPDNPQPRLLKTVTAAIQAHDVVILPTDNGYRFAFGVNAKAAFERLTRLGVDGSDVMLVCQDLSQMASYAQINNEAFRTIKNQLAPQTAFKLIPTKAVNKKIITQDLLLTTTSTPILTSLLKALNEPLLIAPLVYQGEPIETYYDIADQLHTQAEIFVDVGELDNHSVDIVDLTP